MEDSNCSCAVDIEVAAVQMHSAAAAAAAAGHVDVVGHLVGRTDSPSRRSSLGYCVLLDQT